jgi:5-formaminoimidazole-4-carboxamide-1-(beta)-D-ribofuranosyl 5'-monophosphate synthetase
MLDRAKIWQILDCYDIKNLKIGTIGSHSALDIADGATAEGFRTILYCQKGREKTYTKYFRCVTEHNFTRGVVNDYVIYDKFNQILDEQQKIIENNVIFIPNRAFTSYIDIKKIEDEFSVPLFGTRSLLLTEERSEEKNYYWLLKKGGLPYPEEISDPRDIDTLVIVKLHHAQKKLERGFFTASTYQEYLKKSENLKKDNVITSEDLNNARIEKYIIGPVFNLNFFYSPLDNQVELLGIDWRFESSLDGYVRLPAKQQLALNIIPEYTVCGHNSATLRESLLEKVFELGEKYVVATKKYFEPGIIGPFCLQTCVDKDLNFYVYDVAPRIGGGTNVHIFIGHSYGNMLWRTNMSTGRRIALEIKRALRTNDLKCVVT